MKGSYSPRSLLKAIRGTRILQKLDTLNYHRNITDRSTSYLARFIFGVDYHLAFSNKLLAKLTFIASDALSADRSPVWAFSFPKQLAICYRASIEESSSELGSTKRSLRDDQKNSDSRFEPTNISIKNAYIKELPMPIRRGDNHPPASGGLELRDSGDSTDHTNLK
jgi:hypothetical protein